MVLEHLHRIVFLNKVQFKYILFDSWFSASKTLKYIQHKLKKFFVCPLKHNRLVALNEQDKQQGKFMHVSQVPLKSQEVRKVWIKAAAARG